MGHELLTVHLKLGQAAAAAQTQIRHTHAHTDIGNVSAFLPFFLLSSLSK